jgi:hypothetical protein
MKILKIVRNWWWAKQRRFDLTTLWPACKKHARSIDHARAGFALHAFHDPAWIKFYGKERLKQVIDQLE